MEIATLPVRVDKSHLVTIGERLYAESIELIRELVNNAYDADATDVHVTVSDDEVCVDDNGLGMDLEGLREYFTIGTSDKRVHPRSPRFDRPRIGQFGIGKFATLSACDRFTVATKRGSFAAEVVFDKMEWERAGDRWDLPMRLVPPCSDRASGTTVTLSRLRRRFDVLEVERRLLESVPLGAPNFAVFVNGRRLVLQRLPGHRIPILEGTPYGPVHGEIVIVPAYLASTSEMGVEVKVRQVTVCRELFGMEAWGSQAARVKGEVHADFLPVTADRSGFVRDSDQFRAFWEAVARVMAEVRQTLGRLSDRKERHKARRIVREAFRLVQRALARNPDLSPFGAVPQSAQSGLGGGGAVVPERPRRVARDAEAPPPDAGSTAPETAAHPTAAPPEIPPLSSSDEPAGRPPVGARRRKPRVRRLTADAVVQRTRLGEAGVTCCLDHFGPEGREAFHEGAIIYINRDHPLYVRNSRRRDTYTLHLTRLLTQEISLMKNPRGPREAFERQSKLLRDAFADDED